MSVARCASIGAWGASAGRGPSRRAASRRRTATWWRRRRRRRNLLNRLLRARFRPCRRRRRPGRRGVARRAARRPSRSGWCSGSVDVLFPLSVPDLIFGSNGFLRTATYCHCLVSSTAQGPVPTGRASFSHVSSLGKVLRLARLCLERESRLLNPPPGSTDPERFATVSIALDTASL